jgi:hypothetical protein
MDVKSLVGKKSKSFSVLVTQESISNFCKAVGEPDSKVAPPTFMTTFREPEFKLFEEIGVPLANVLHGEQEYEYHAPIVAGMRLNFEAQFVRANEKRARLAVMKFLVLETRFIDEQTRNPVGTSRTTIIARQALEAP